MRSADDKLFLYFARVGLDYSRPHLNVAHTAYIKKKQCSSCYRCTE